METIYYNWPIKNVQKVFEYCQWQWPEPYGCYKKELSKDKKGNVTWHISYNTSSD